MLQTLYALAAMVGTITVAGTIIAGIALAKQQHDDEKKKRDETFRQIESNLREVIRELDGIKARLKV